MNKKTARPARQTPRVSRLPDTHLHLTDRRTCAWQDHQLTWHGNQTDDSVCVMAAAPAGFHVAAVLQPERPYLWIGIAAPDTLAARLCYATISGETLRELATRILQYAPKKGGIAMTAPIPNRATPPGADSWLADLIEFTVADYGTHPVPAERLKWVITRIMCASTLSDQRQSAIRDQLFVNRRKAGGR